MEKNKLEDKLIIGAKIKIGPNYAEKHGLENGQIIELVEGYFEYDNGLYVEDQTCPSFKEEDGEYSSIYHLFGNDIEDFMDCEIIN